MISSIGFKNSSIDSSINAQQHYTFDFPTPSPKKKKPINRDEFIQKKIKETVEPNGHCYVAVDTDGRLNILTKGKYDEAMDLSFDRTKSLVAHIAEHFGFTPAEHSGKFRAHIPEPKLDWKAFLPKRA
jgi:hypothetical protein